MKSKIKQNLNLKYKQIEVNINNMNYIINQKYVLIVSYTYCM